MAKTPTWQRKAGQNPNGGLNEAGRRSLKAAGHDIKRPQPEGGSRRDSFCARMKGMKAKLTSSETANDPDSRINKSLRAWNCHADGGPVWEKDRPKSLGKPQALTPSEKKSAKAHAKAAGRPYPNLIDNMRAARADGGALKAALKLAQEITSAKTSINQVPGLFKSKLLESLPSHRNLDIGGGKYDTGTDYLRSRGIESHVYDPYNRAAEHNEAVMSRFKENPADSVTVANVLNVIKEPEARQAVIQQALDALRPGGKAYFSVYEGNRSGAGAETPKGWQENRKALEYLDEIKKHFPEAQRKGDIIYGARPEMGAGGDAFKAAMNVIRAYHGSPHKFDKFDIGKIGTGEGAQAYGHGLYFAGNEDVARSYRDALAHKADPRNAINDLVYQFTQGKVAAPTPENIKYFISQDQSIKDYADNKNIMSRVRDIIQGHEPGGTVNGDAMHAYRELEHLLPEPSKGHMYEVGIKANPEQMINWDRPLYKQPSGIKDAFSSIIGKGPRVGWYDDLLGEDAYRLATNTLARQAREKGVSPASEASSVLQSEHGIPGIKYLDAGSRRAGEGSNNYVVFDPKIIDIMRRYADGGRIHFEEGGLARIERLIKEAQGEKSAEEMAHPIGMSGSVEFAPVEINEPITGSKIPLGSLPTPTASVVNPLANMIAQYGPYAAGGIPAGLAAARDLVTGLKEGSGLDVATAAMGAPGKALRYGLPALGGMTDLLSPTEAQAGPLSSILHGAYDMSKAGIRFRRPEILRVQHPYFPEGAQLNLHGAVSPFSEDEAIRQHAMEIAAKYATPLENKPRVTGGYYGPKQSVAPLDVQRTITDIPGIAPLAKPQQSSWEDFYKIGKGGSFINLAGDRSDFGRLTHIQGKPLEWPVDLHAGPKYMLEPNPGEVWANAPEHATKLKKEIGKHKEGPVFGVYVPMGPQSVTSAHHMFDAVMSQMRGANIDKDALKAFDDVLRRGEHFGADAKNKKNAIEYMKGNIKGKDIGPWPGLNNPKEASEWARNLPGHHRAAILKEMEKAHWNRQGFPEIGVTRVAVTDPEFLKTPGNVLGGRMVELTPKKTASEDPLFTHGTYGSATYGRHVMDLPMVQRQYAMPEAIKEYINPTGTGTVVHPYASYGPSMTKEESKKSDLGRGSFRKLFETNFRSQPITQQWLDTIMAGMERQKQYGFKHGGRSK